MRPAGLAGRSAAAPATVGVETRAEATDFVTESGRRRAAVKRQPGDLPSRGYAKAAGGAAREV
jgi:hypothetical protein